MVRADHEDGGILNPDEHPEAENPEAEIPEVESTEVESTADAPAPKARPVVVKRSPLGRKPNLKKAAPATTEPDTAESVTAKSDAIETDAIEADAVEADGTAADEPDEADEVLVSAESVSYRDRRISAQQRRSAASANKRVPRAGLGRAIAMVVAALLVVGGVVASVIFGMGLQRLAHERDLRAEYAAFARQVVVQMTTLDSENADAMYDLTLQRTSGRAQQVFRDNMKTVADMIRQADAVTKTTVLTEAVSESNDTEGTVLMVIGWESRDKAGQQEPMYQTFRYLVGMTRINDELKVTDLEFVW